MYPTNLKKQNTIHFTGYVSRSRIDRISPLPIEIVHHIMTFLPTKYATRTSALSKRFNSLWWSFSRIDLNENDHYIHAIKHSLGNGPYTRNKFLDHMRQCYMRHDLKFVEKLRIRALESINAWEEINLSPLIDSFLFASIEGEALKEIDLRFPITEEPPLQDLTNVDYFHGSFYMMPEIPLFTWCESLETLKLEGCSFEEFGTMVLNIKLPSVKELYIRNCLVSDNFVTKLIHGCPELEDLSIKFCLNVEVVSFSHSKLKKLVMGCHDTSIVLQIDVPNLQTFNFRGAYWTFALADPMNESRLADHHIINAPNLETFCVKYVCVDRVTLQIAVSKFKNLKEMVVSQCYLQRITKFWGQKLESLVISSCEFEEEGLLLTGLFLPVLKSLRITSCKGLEWLSIKSTTLKELILKECIGLEEWVICAPNVSSYRCVNMGN